MYWLVLFLVSYIHHHRDDLWLTLAASAHFANITAARVQNVYYTSSRFLAGVIATYLASEFEIPLNFPLQDAE